MQQFFFLFFSTERGPYPLTLPPPHTLPPLPLPHEFTSVVHGWYTVSVISTATLDPPLIALGIQRVALGTCAPSRSNFFLFKQFLAKTLPNNRFLLQNQELPPPPSPSGKSCIRHWVVFLTPTSGFSLVFHSSCVFPTVEHVAMDYHYVGAIEGFSLSYSVWWN